MNLVFLGCGLATQLHSKTLKRIGAPVRLFYASRQPEKAIAYDRRYQGGGAFDSYEAAIADDRVDIVLVATPPSSHLDFTLRALRARKHVIVEKPPFLRSSDFDLVRQAQSATGRRVFVAENYFYKPLAFTLREIIRSGALGEIRFLHVNALKVQHTGDWRDDPALSGGGALFEGGIHWINFIANLGLHVRRVRGFRSGNTRDGDRSMLVVAEYEEGAVGTLSFSWEVPSPLRGARLSRIYGTRSSLAFESNGLFIIGQRGRRLILIPDLRDLAGYRAMFRDFFRALSSGEEALLSLDLARRDLELVEAVYRSLET